MDKISLKSGTKMAQIAIEYDCLRLSQKQALRGKYDDF